MLQEKEFYTARSNIQGIGLYSKKTYRKGEHISYISGPIIVFRSFTPQISQRMLDWIGVGRFSWIDTSNSMFRFINHSCEPNVAIVSRRKVIALQDILAGEELTMDYSLTEAEPGWHIICNCTSKKCRHEIGPITSIPKHVYRSYLPNIPKNFQKIYEKDNKLST